MEDIKLDGLIVIKDSVDCNGERLWISFVEKARRSFTKVRLLLTVTWSDTLERRYGCVRKEGVSLESVDRLDTLLTILNGIDGQENDRTAFFIDSINMLLMWCSSIDQMIRLLKALAVRDAVVARIHEEGLLDAIWQRLSVVADVTLCLRMAEDRTAICKGVYYKKSGKQITKTESFKVDDQLRLLCSPYVEEKRAVISEKTKGDNPLEDVVVPFDIGLHLSESELKAKRSVKLPYMAAQTQEGLVGISASGKRKVRAGGRIIYTPDEADDLDDSDPDDDLQI